MFYNIESIIIDVDGTLTSGSITYDNLGNEYKSFSVKDGMILNYLSNKKKIMILTGKKSNINDIRFKSLGIDSIYQGINNKSEFIEKNLDINLSKTLYIGDDINDYKAMKMCKYRACPIDADSRIQEIASFISTKKGGEAAVREILENYFEISIDSMYDKKQ